MSIYEFKNNDVILNTIKTHPEHHFFIYDGKIYYQKQNKITGSQVSNVFGIPTGFVSLYEINVDRTPKDTGRTIGQSQVPDTNLIYPFLIKDGTGNSFKTTTKQQYDALEAGALMTSSYNISSSIARKFIPSNSYANARILSENVISSFQNTIDVQNVSVIQANYKASASSAISYLHALENPLNSYSLYSPHYYMSSSYGDKRIQNVNLVYIPTVFFGSGIKKGSVKLQYYITGTLIAELSDKKQNGVLIQSSGTISSNNDKVAGVVLYKHGVILLTGSWSLDSRTINYDNSDNSKWIYWGAGANDTLTGSNNSRVSASFALEFKGTQRIPNLTAFATAPKSELNWSNNPTFLATSSIAFTGKGIQSSSNFYKEQQFSIHNIVSSSYGNHSASFENITYINTVNLYDELGNLIGIAKTSKPIKKTPYNDFTFKLKLDM